MGGGHMASAIVRGALAASLFAPRDIIVCEPDAGKRDAFKALGVMATASHAEAMAQTHAATMLLLAVKPQMFPVLSEQLRPHVSRDPLVVSIMAGVTQAAIRTQLPTPSGRVVRTMPNLPASIGLGITAIAAAPHVAEAPSKGGATSSADLARVQALFNAVGRTVVIAEDLLDAFTALAGSGPAYLFYLAEAMTNAAARCGFAPDAADVIVRQTLLGAATMLAQQAEQAAPALRAAVTSKGGTTEAAIAHLDQHGVLKMIADAIIAGRDRGRELGGGGKRDGVSG